jgi:parallel beta-helix repeat protein
MLTLAFNIHPVKATGTIYIRADGSIDPPTAPISTVDNITYTFTGDINDSIVVERDNILVDGTGYTLQGTYAYESRGTDVTGRSNVTIKNTNITNFWYGIYLNSSSNYNGISGNNITNNEYGIFFGDSSSNSISGNDITNNGVYGIYLDSSSNHNSISGNYMTNNGGGIMLASSNSTISGNYIIANNGTGVYLGFSSSNSISGNYIIANNGTGVILESSSSNSISGNNITNNGRGITLLSCSSNSISGNNFINNGLFVKYSFQNSVENNTVNGRPLVYLEGVSNYTVDDAGQVILVRSENIKVEGLNLSRTDVGVELWQTSNSTISGNYITANNGDGISLDYSSNYNGISGNYISANNDDGILLFYCSGTGISGNNISANNYDGILLYSSSNSSISGNNITANSNRGIEFYFSSSYNSIFHNNFINNAQQVYSLDSVNVWDNGYPSAGNYWSDYTGTDGFRGPFQNETGSDRIGDAPYVIDSDNADTYPLMNLWVRLPGDINGDGAVDIYDAILLANAYNSTPGKPNWKPNADINGDNIVDIYDAILLANSYNQHYP